VDKDILVMGDFNVEDEEMFKVLTNYGAGILSRPTAVWPAHPATGGVQRTTPNR
jgi:hypothetical protein